MRKRKQAISVVRLLSVILVFFLTWTGFDGTAAVAQETAMPGGYVAEVTDTSGTTLTVYGFSFGYRYGYRRANCIGACGATAGSTLQVLPLNEDCGATMVPFSEIRSISQIRARARRRGYLEATIMFDDGREIKTRFGMFGGERLHSLKGQSALGAYSLEIEKTVEIVFQHDRNITPMPEERKPGSDDAKSIVSVECPDGASYSLSNAAFYPIHPNGKVRNTIDTTLSVRIGESEITMDLDRIQSLVLTGDSGTGSMYTLTTTAGEAISVTLADTSKLKYIGGFRDGHFYYVKLTNLKSATVRH